MPLADNYPEDTFRYELHVHTGFKRHSGTRSNVFFRIGGTEGETGTRRMADGLRKVHLSPSVYGCTATRR